MYKFLLHRIYYLIFLTSKYFQSQAGKEGIVREIFEAMKANEDNEGQFLFELAACFFSFAVAVILCLPHRSDR